MKYALTDIVSAILGQQVRETRVNALVRCPFHDDRVASMSIHLETGFWICFTCGERGGLSSLSTRLGGRYSDAELALKAYEGGREAFYEEPKDFAVLAKQLRANLVAEQPDAVVRFLTERGIKPAALRYFGIGWKAGGRIAFPYYDDEAVIGIKYRDAAGHKTMETGSRRGIYNVNNVRQRPYVFLCEGESDTLAVWSHLTDLGLSDTVLSRIGVGGVPGVAGSTSRWDVWGLDLMWAKKVYVMYDADEAGDQGAILPMEALPDRCVRIRPTRGNDMNDHLLEGGTLNDFDGLADAFREPEAAPRLG